MSPTEKLKMIRDGFDNSKDLFYASELFNQFRSEFSNVNSFVANLKNNGYNNLFERIQENFQISKQSFFNSNFYNDFKKSFDEENPIIIRLKNLGKTLEDDGMSIDRSVLEKIQEISDNKESLNEISNKKILKLKH